MNEGRRLASCGRVVSTWLLEELSAGEEELEARGAALHTSRELLMFLSAAQEVSEQLTDAEQNHREHPIILVLAVPLSGPSKEPLKTKQLLTDDSMMISMPGLRF